MAKKVMDKLTGFSQGVRPGAALRDVTLGQPICPNSQIRGKIVNGQYEAPIIQAGMENCQLAGGEWYVECEAKGHDPYFRTQTMYQTVDIEEADPDTGEMFVVGSKKRKIEVRTVNATQVSPSIMHNSGHGVARKIKYLGYKRLKDLGVSEVCQYRGCQKEPTVRVPGLGDYCDILHLNLIAAREEGEYLTAENVAGLNAGYEAQAKKKRTRQLQTVLPRVIERLKA